MKKKLLHIDLMESLQMPSDRVEYIDDITQTLNVRRGKMLFKQYYPPTHYACPEMSSGSFIEDHLELSSSTSIKLMAITDDMDVLCDTVCQNRCGRAKYVGGELW